jgi:hypothetical protein
LDGGKLKTVIGFLGPKKRSSGKEVPSEAIDL